MGGEESECLIVCAGQRVAQEGSSPSGALMESTVSKSGGNASLAVACGLRGGVEQAKHLGLPITVVPTTGQELVVVQRMDLDARTDPRARELALADNRVAELDLDWDPAVLRQLEQAGVALEAFWTPEEFAGSSPRRDRRRSPTKTPCWPRPPRPRSGAATCSNSAATASRAGTRRRRRTSPGSSPGPPRA